MTRDGVSVWAITSPAQRNDTVARADQRAFRTSAPGWRGLASGSVRKVGERRPGPGPGPLQASLAHFPHPQGAQGKIIRRSAAYMEPMGMEPMGMEPMSILRVVSTRHGQAQTLFAKSPRSRTSPGFRKEPTGRPLASPREPGGSNLPDEMKQVLDRGIGWSGSPGIASGGVSSRKHAPGILSGSCFYLCFYLCFYFHLPAKKKALYPGNEPGIRPTQSAIDGLIGIIFVGCIEMGAATFWADGNGRLHGILHSYGMI